jgi:hypothetical protein
MPSPVRTALARSTYWSPRNFGRLTFGSFSTFFFIAGDIDRNGMITRSRQYPEFE